MVTGNGSDADFGFERAEPAPDPEQAAAMEVAANWVGGPVHGVGIGETSDGRPCVVVFADTPPDDLPDQVEGLPVRVEASDTFTTQAPPPDDARPDDDRA